ASVLFACLVFTFVRFVARYRNCTAGGVYDVFVVFNGVFNDAFPSISPHQDANRIFLVDITEILVQRVHAWEGHE
ncbi:hypothetical protein N9L68_09255, partial [bacterium]|nr:hypothetical protein [bacterium]